MNEEYMKIALELAIKGKSKVNPNPMVGAIVVKDGKILGQGYHRQYGGPHAEVYALEEAGAKAKGADIYVSLEPCSHYGKTPPCADKIIDYGIKRCIIASKDPNPLVAGRGIKKLEEAGIEVILGILDKENRELNEVFMKYIKEKEAFAFLKTAITLDGKIACSTGDSKWISNDQSRKEVQSLRSDYMAIMVGINTVISDNPRLNARIEGGRDPYRIIIDPRLRIELESNVIKNNSDAKTIILVSEKLYNREKEIKLRDRVKIIKMENDYFSAEEILKKLAELKIDSVLIEGGSRVISQFVKEKKIDKGVIFIAPKLVGDKDAVPILSGFKTDKMSESMKLKDVEYKIVGDNIGVYFKGVE